MNRRTFIKSVAGLVAATALGEGVLAQKPPEIYAAVDMAAEPVFTGVMKMTICWRENTDGAEWRVDDTIYIEQVGTEPVVLKGPPPNTTVESIAVYNWEQK